jgi:hypothetical protein
MTETAVRHGAGRLLQGPGRGGEHDVGGGVGVGAFRVRVLALAHGDEDVAFGEDADTAGVGVVDDGRADLAGGHQCGGLADGEDDGAHGVTDEHEWASWEWSRRLFMFSQVHKRADSQGGR